MDRAHYWHRYACTGLANFMHRVNHVLGIPLIWGWPFQGTSWAKLGLHSKYLPRIILYTLNWTIGHERAYEEQRPARLCGSHYYLAQLNGIIEYFQINLYVWEGDDFGVTFNCFLPSVLCSIRSYSINIIIINIKTWICTLTFSLRIFVPACVGL
jgi:hypothetical protein